MNNSDSSSPKSPTSPSTQIQTALVLPNNEGSMEVDSPPVGATATSTTLDEGRQKRRKCRIPTACSCPVCGVTLRPGEISSHLALELDKLVRLPQSRRVSQRTPIASAPSPINTDISTPSTSAASSSELTSSTSKQKERHRKGKGWQKYERIRSSRLIRTRQKRRRGDTDDDNEGGGEGGYGERECPVCDKHFLASDIQRHIERCLRKAETEFEDDEVDVEGDGDDEGEYEEYEWCGVTRVRATTLLGEGQLHALGTKVKRGSEDEMVDVCDEDANTFGPSQYRDEDLANPNNDQKNSHHLDDDIHNHRPHHHYHHGDDLTDYPESIDHSSQSSISAITQTDSGGNHIHSFGGHHVDGGASRCYSPGHFSSKHNDTLSNSEEFDVCCSSVASPTDRGDDVRTQSVANTLHSECSPGIKSSCEVIDTDVSAAGSSTSQNLSSNGHKSSTLSSIVGDDDPTLSSVKNSSGDDEEEANDLRIRCTSGGDGGGGGAVVEALRARMRELEEDRHLGRYTCRVCHGEYEKPVVSVSCWHVHCETCWLQALAAKKLCPQCSVITTAADLRRVYL